MDFSERLLLPFSLSFCDIFVGQILGKPIVNLNSVDVMQAEAYPSNVIDCDYNSARAHP